MNKIILATALTLMCGSAFAQSTGAPANAQSDMNKPMNNNMDKGSMSNTTGSGTTTGSSMPSSKDASTQGAGTAGSVDRKGDAASPGGMMKK